MLKTMTVVALLQVLYACGGQPVVSAQAAHAKPTTMPQELIREAIAKGVTSENVLSTDSGAYVLVSTPYLRIARAAEAAKKRYQPFTEGDVTPEMAAPEALLWTGALGAAKTIAVVIAPSGSTDNAQLIRPIRTVPAPDPDAPTAIIGVFPIEALRDGHEVRIVYEPPAHDAGLFSKLCPKPGPTKDTIECVVPIDMGKVR